MSDATSALRTHLDDCSSRSGGFIKYKEEFCNEQKASVAGGQSLILLSLKRVNIFLVCFMVDFC